jgi:DNA-binding response OmpR family regulator
MTEKTLKKQGSLEPGPVAKNDQAAVHILFAEGDQRERHRLAKRLRDESYYVTECRDGMQLVDHLDRYLFPEQGEAERYDLIISGNRTAGVTGMEILEAARQLEGFPPMVLITAFEDAQTHKRARQLGVVALFDQPFDVEEMVCEVRKAIERSRPVSRTPASSAPPAESSHSSRSGNHHRK